MAKIDQNGKGSAFTFFAVFGHFFNFIKTAEKGLKSRQKSLKMIQKRLDFVFEPFLKRWKGGKNS